MRIEKNNKKLSYISVLSATLGISDNLSIHLLKLKTVFAITIPRMYTYIHVHIFQTAILSQINLSFKIGYSHSTHQPHFDILIVIKTITCHTPIRFNFSTIESVFFLQKNLVGGCMLFETRVMGFRFSTNLRYLIYEI